MSIFISLLIYLRFVIITGFIIFCLSSFGFAQYYPGSRSSMRASYVVPSADEDKSIKKIKDKVERLLSENKQLEAQYSVLQKQYNELKNKVDEQLEEVSLLQQYVSNERAKREQKSQSIPSLKMQLQRLQDDMLLHKSSNMYLRAQLLDTEENLRLWELKVSDLKLYRKELQMDLKYKQYKANEKQKEQTVEIDTLKKQLEGLLKKEEDILSSIGDISEKGSNAVERIAALKRENEQMKEKIRNLQHQKDIKLKENSILKDKKILIVRTGEDMLARKQQLKTQYEEIVGHLEEEYSYLSKLMETLVAQQKKRTELMKQIIKIDKENQQLRMKIEKAKQKHK